jgi:hypothetical protein
VVAVAENKVMLRRIHSEKMAAQAAVQVILAYLPVQRLHRHKVLQAVLLVVAAIQVLVAAQAQLASRAVQAEMGKAQTSLAAM